MYIKIYVINNNMYILIHVFHIYNDLTLITVTVTTQVVLSPHKTYNC